LSDWVRAQAKEMGITYELLTLDVVQKAVIEHLPGKARLVSKYLPDSASVQDWLQHMLGIMEVVKVGVDVIAWGAATNEAEAEVLQQAYSAKTYRQICQALGIRYQWILLLHPVYLTTSGDIIEAHMTFVEGGLQECSIIRC
jgi:hypothetical protein